MQGDKQKEAAFGNCWKSLHHNVSAMVLGESQLKSEFFDPGIKGLASSCLGFFLYDERKGEGAFFHSRFALPDLGPNVPALFAVASLTLCIF